MVTVPNKVTNSHIAQPSFFDIKGCVLRRRARVSLLIVPQTMASIIRLDANKHPIKSVTVFKSNKAEVVRIFKVSLEVSL
jgi:hypothetical protein